MLKMETSKFKLQSRKLEQEKKKNEMLLRERHNEYDDEEEDDEDHDDDDDDDTDNEMPPLIDRRELTSTKGRIIKPIQKFGSQVEDYLPTQKKKEQVKSSRGKIRTAKDI